MTDHEEYLRQMRTYLQSQDDITIIDLYYRLKRCVTDESVIDAETEKIFASFNFSLEYSWLRAYMQLCMQEALRRVCSSDRPSGSGVVQTIRRMPQFDLEWEDMAVCCVTNRMWTRSMPPGLGHHGLMTVDDPLLVGIVALLEAFRASQPAPADD